MPHSPETSNPRSSASRWRALRPLRHRDYRLLIGAVALSICGSGMWTIVLTFQVLAVDDSPTALSAVAACLSAGLLAFAIVGGIAADRCPRRAVLIMVELANTVATAAVAVLGLSGAIQLWHLAVASAVLGAGSAFYYPAYTAFLPQILPPEELLAANGLEGALRPTMQAALGPAIAGVIVGALFPAAGAVVVAALSASALVLTVLVRPVEVPRPSAADEARPGVLADLRAGVLFVLGTRWLLWTLLFAALTSLVIMGPIEVLLPFVTRARFDRGAEAFGLLLTAFGVGGALGSLAMSSLRLPRRYLSAMVLLWGAGTLPLALVGVTGSFPVMVAALFVVGATSGAGLVIWGTLLQRRVPPAMMGRVASLDFFVSISLMPLSMALAGPVASVVPIPVVFVVAAALPPVVAVLAVFAGAMPRDELAHPLDQPADDSDAAAGA
ncbi:MFS transporter [Pseudonocardia humida]|uniref:MFS transporter n=1 Tax=Pseudonocardia humida TaxID=2800819 RepID=A0ABT1A3M0_9PSEU|nr:MFS transporter [Pseudonocardia humida]MCO1657596.1 MFS transporter [Pseudonocardia humida]